MPQTLLAFFDESVDFPGGELWPNFFEGELEYFGYLMGGKWSGFEGLPEDFFGD